MEKQVMLMCYFLFLGLREFSIWHPYHQNPELKAVSKLLDALERMRQRERLRTNSLSAAQLIHSIRVLLFKST